MAATSFYISKQDLVSTIDYFQSNKPSSVGGKVLKGLVFRVGTNNLGEEALFADVLYSDNPTGPPDEKQDMLITNEVIGPGCPYPPGYPLTVKR